MLPGPENITAAAAGQGPAPVMTAQSVPEALGVVQGESPQEPVAPKSWASCTCSAAQRSSPPSSGPEYCRGGWETRVLRNHALLY